jgi:hypothetical protein
MLPEKVINCEEGETFPLLTSSENELKTPKRNQKWKFLLAAISVIGIKYNYQ